MGCARVHTLAGWTFPNPARVLPAPPFITPPRRLC